MSKDISKSPEMLQKEAAVKKLQQQLKSRKSTLKGLKTRLTNNKTEIEDIQYKSSTRVMSTMERMDELQKELAVLAKKALKIKGLSKRDKVALQEMAEMFEQEDMLGEDYKAYQQKKAEHLENGFSFEEDAKAKMRDLFEGLQVKPDEQEQKDIRKVFVKLSNKFHPDRARTEKEAKEFHEMQQKLNNAYQNGDIQTLLEMERLLLTEEIDLSDPKAYTVDVLQQAIERLEKELSFIENQILRIRQEIKNLKDSDLGDMLTDIRRAKKDGYSIDDSIEEMEYSIKMITEIRDALKESVEMGKLSPKFIQLAMGNNSPMGFSPDGTEMNPQDAIDMLTEMIGKDGKGMEEVMGMMESMYGGMEEEEDLFEHATFKEGQSVKITKAIKHPRAKKFSLKNCLGRVADVDYDFNGQLVYTVSLDSVSLSALPPIAISESVEWGEDFQDMEGIAEKHLVAYPSRDTKEDSHISYRKLLHQYKWTHLDKAQAERIRNILLADLRKNDQENWMDHLEKVDFPVNAIILGFLHIPENTKVKILGLADMHFEDGIIVNIHVKKEKGRYPLYDLQITDTNPALQTIFDDYEEWFEDYSADAEEDTFFF